MNRYQKISDSTTPVVTIVDRGDHCVRHYRRPDYTPLDAIVTVDWLNERERINNEPLRVIGGQDHGAVRAPRPRK